jgi:hypothetical protein
MTLINFYLSEEDCVELGFTGEDVRDYRGDLDYALKGAYTMQASVYPTHRFGGDIDLHCTVRGEGLDRDEVERTVRELARRVFAGEIE